MMPANKDQFDTLPKILRYNLEKYRKKVAMREKDRGIWKRYLWEDYYEKVKFLSLGLMSLGLKRGDKVALLGETKPEAFWGELATHTAGGVIVGIFSDCIPSEVQFYLDHSDSTFVFAEDQEQVDKVLSIKDNLPKLKRVIYWEPKGLWFYNDPILMSFETLLDLGKKYEEEHTGSFEQMIDRGQGEDIALIVYTSGTTGIPKGATISHWGIVKGAEAQASVINLRQGDEWVAFMPLAWIGGQLIDLASALLLGLTVNFPERPETVQENIREIGAHGLLFSPRQWEAINRMIQGKMVEASFINRFIYNLFLPIALKNADSHLGGRNLSFVYKLIYFLGDSLVFKHLKDRIGLKNLKVAFTGGTAISPDIIRFFHGIGIKLKQLYGSSEMGLMTAHRDTVKPETSGIPLPGVEIKLGDDGEILVKAPWRFINYHKDLNNEAFNTKIIDGWYYTGDFGHIDKDNHLIVMDRMEDLRMLSSGRKFSPQYTETRIRFSPFIKEAIVVGGEKEFVSTVINIDLDNTGHWAEARKLSYTTFADLSQKAEIIDLIRGELEKVNKTLPDYAKIKKFVNLHKEFDPDEAELTRSRKLKRSFLESKYAELMAALYGQRDEIMVETEVTYRDGRKGIMKRPIKIVSIS